MKPLRPVDHIREPGYPTRLNISRSLKKSVMILATMSAFSIGGCSEIGSVPLESTEAGTEEIVDAGPDVSDGDSLASIEPSAAIKRAMSEESLERPLSLSLDTESGQPNSNQVKQPTIVTPTIAPPSIPGPTMPQVQNPQIQVPQIQVPNVGLNGTNNPKPPNIVVPVPVKPTPHVIRTAGVRPPPRLAGRRPSPRI